MEYLLTGGEMASCDARTSEVIGIPSLVLMERAALSVADGVDRYLQSKQAAQKDGRMSRPAGRAGGKKPLILAVAGRGNNGADALAAGRILLERGYDVRFCRLSGEISPGSSFAVQESILSHFDAAVEPFPSCDFHIPDVIIDGLFGTGLSRNLQGEAADCVHAINRCRESFGTYVVGVDIPSGISSEDGSVMGAAVRCDETRTFAFYKRGHFMYPGTEYAGTIHLAQIGITERAFGAEPGMFTFLTEKPGALVPRRNAGGNKGTFGKVLVIAGRRNMCGAAVLAARACMAAGAGMVKVFTHEANRLIVQQMLPEALLETYCEEEASLPDAGCEGSAAFPDAGCEGPAAFADVGLEGEASFPDTGRAQALPSVLPVAEKLRRSLDWADVCAAGPAMGTDPLAEMLLRTLLQYAGSNDGGRTKGGKDGKESGNQQGNRGSKQLRGLVLDADALRMIAGDPALRGLLSGRRPGLPCILTPHMAEFAALAGRSVSACMADRTGLVRDQADLLDCVIACKDARTLIAAPRGKRLYLNCCGNSGMASAGSGDVLTGITAGLLAQLPGSERGIFTPEETASGFATACSAVFLHGKAGDAARSLYGEYSMTAGDLIQAMRSDTFLKG